MSRFDRMVDRKKSEFDFTEKQEEKPTRFQEFKENFGFKWLTINIRTVIYMILDFMVVNFLFIPLLMNYYPPMTSFILGHGVLTSLLIVITFYFIGEDKPKLSALFVRYCFMALLLGVISFVSTLVM